jgi:hypothetical protein
MITVFQYNFMVTKIKIPYNVHISKYSFNLVSPGLNRQTDLEFTSNEKGNKTEL